MVKTFEIDLDDALVENASSVFEKLGTDIDTAIKMFLTQATLRKGFPFEVVIPGGEGESGDLKAENEAPCAGKSPADAEVSPVSGMPAADQETSESGVPPAEAANAQISDEVAARVAANEALVAQMREEIGDKAVTPEFDEGEELEIQNAESGGQNDSAGEKSVDEEAAPEGESPVADTEAAPMSEIPVEENVSSQEEVVAGAEKNASSDEEEEEDETTPDNLFDAWDVGEEEDIGCR